MCFILRKEEETEEVVGWGREINADKIKPLFSHDLLLLWEKELWVRENEKEKYAKILRKKKWLKKLPFKHSYFFFTYHIESEKIVLFIFLWLCF